MFDVQARARRQMFGSAALFGIGAALLAASFLFPMFGGLARRVAAMISMMIGAGWSRRITPSGPPRWQLAAIASGTFAAGMALAWLITPRPGSIHLEHRVLPGVAIDMPADDDVRVDPEFSAGRGRSMSVRPGGLDVVIALAWERGEPPRAGDVEAVRARIGARAHDELGAIRDDYALRYPHASYAITTARGRGVATLFACGDLTYALITIGEGAETLQRRIAATVACDGDQAL